MGESIEDIAAYVNRMRYRGPDRRMRSKFSWAEQISKNLVVIATIVFGLFAGWVAFETRLTSLETAFMYQKEKIDAIYVHLILPKVSTRHDHSP